MKEGSNNDGENWAVGMALTYLKENGYSVLPTHLFTDSRVTLGQVESGWRFKKNKHVIHALHSLRAEFPLLQIFKVPAHCSIEGNEEADALADEGSSRSPPSQDPLLFSYTIHSITTT